MTRILHAVLNDASLGFLALLSLFLMFMPMVFPLSARGTGLVEALEYLIIAVFAAEYMYALSRAADKRQFVRNWWRIIDALIILTAVIAVIPAVPDVLKNSPAFRIFRLGRLALLGTKSGFALKSSFDESASAPATQPVLAVSALAAAGDRFEQIPWEQGLRRINSAGADWLFISGVTEDRLAPIADALAVPENAVRGLFQSSVPRFDHLERFTTFFVRYPLPQLPGEKLKRTPVLLVGSAENVVVLSRENTNLELRVGERLAGLGEELPPMVRVTVALLGEIIRAYNDVARHLEANLLQIESTQSELKDEAFLSSTFDLRTDILRVRSSIKHLRSVMRDLSTGELSFAGSDAENRGLYRRLADDIHDLYEAIEDLRESLQALVDLRLNVSSFQMNRVMRLLALLTSLALIPATAGGLLGMNLLDTPWPASLAQVSFGVAAGMALSLYVFAIKGWLR